MPTDFSDTAKNAFQYAKQLAKKLNGHLKVVHCWYPDLDIVNGLSAPPVELVMKTRKKFLDDFIQSNKIEQGGDDASKNVIESEVLVGFAGTALEEASANKDIDLIVMGTTGDGGTMEKIFGSISSHVSQNAQCPVWLVPPKAQFKGIKNVMYASDFPALDNDIIHQVVHLANLFDASIHLVHVNKENNEEVYEMKNIAKKVGSSVKFSLTTVHNESIWEGLDKYAHEHEIDLMVLVTRHRSFWEKLLHKSQTKEIVLHAEIPLMVLHMDDKNEI